MTFKIFDIFPQHLTKHFIDAIARNTPGELFFDTAAVP